MRTWRKIAGAGRPSGVLLAALFLALAGAALSVQASLALFTSAASVPGSTFSTASSWPKVQTGTAQSTGNGTITVSISAVDPSKSFLLFQTRHDSNRPPGSMMRGRIRDATTLEFVRVTDETSTIDIRWYVVEHPRVAVQRGELVQDSTTKDAAIAGVASLSQAFVTWSKTPGATNQTWGVDDAIICELTTTTNLQCRSNTASAEHVIWWQVIEFTDGADVNVQKGVTSLTGGALSTTATLGTAVDMSKAFLLVGFRTAGSGADVGARMLRAQLTNATTLQFDRGTGGDADDITEIGWQVVELKDGSTVQQGSEAFATGVAQRTVSINSVATTRSVAFASVQPVGGQNMGKSPYAADDIIGVCSVTMGLTGTQVVMDRTATQSTCDVAWFVVQFAP